MKVRFRSPEKLDSWRNERVGIPEGPSKRPGVPGWRWHLLVLILALPLLWLLFRFAADLTRLTGRGYVIYPAPPLYEPPTGPLQKSVRTRSDAAQFAGPHVVPASCTAGGGAEPLEGEPPGIDAAPAGQRLGRGGGRGAEGQMRAGVARQPIRTRMTERPSVRAWMEASYLGRLWPGRPASVRLPDGRRIGAVITGMLPGTEILPEGLATSSRVRPSSLVITLQLGETLTTAERIQCLPVEVALRWRDDLTRWWTSRSLN